MKKSISDLYEQVLLNEAEKNSLQNPSNDEVGELPSENMFGTVPNTLKGEGPEKAKLQKGPSYNKVDSGTPVASKQPKQTASKMPNSKPAQSATPDEGVEMEDEEVTLDDEEKDYGTVDKKQKPQKESFTMSAFEELFKKTLREELEEENVELETSDELDDVDMSEEDIDMSEEGEDEEGEEEIQEEEEDLISDLRGLQDKLNSILNKLEALESEEAEGEEDEGEEYSEDDFDDEFGDEEEEEEEAPVKESLQARMKPVNKSKIKTLQNKKNKVGKITPKGGKAKPTKMKITANPTALGDKKKDLQKHNNKVKSSVDKGDFFK
jgi:hypothetical protein